MKNSRLILMASLTFLLNVALAANSPSKVNFYNGSVISAKEKAKAEQKPYFLEFYADWCKPCQWMEEKTFSDDKLANFVNDHFVAVKVNIDDFDGQALKQKYQVEYLPTVIVFSAEGQILGKYEKSLSANKLLKLLKSHQSSATVDSEKNYSMPAKTNQQPSSYVRNASYNEPNSPLFGVQVGVYKNANNVFKLVEELKTTLNEPVNVINHKDATGSSVIYRIVVGKFYSRRAAEEFLGTVKRSGYDGFIKDISDLKDQN